MISMNRAPGPRRHAWALAAGVAISTLLSAAPALALTDADIAQPVRGLIVRLKNPVPNARLAGIGLTDRERAQAATEADAESARWRAVTRHAGLATSATRGLPALRPVGRDQQLLRFDRALAPAEAHALIERLKSHADVDWIEVNTRERLLQVPGDPYFADGSQWWLLPNGGTDANAMEDRRRGVAGFQTAWMQPGGSGNPGFAVAVLDTGITAHPDLLGRVLPGYDFVEDIKFGNDGDGRDDDPSDPGDWVSITDLGDPHFSGCALANSSWHGTVISGMVAAQTNNGDGVAAVNWQGRVLPVRVAGKCGADKADIIDGMRWAAGLDVPGVPRNVNPVRIVNISFGGSAACSADYQAAVDELRAIGVVVVAAAGNEHGWPTRPASCTGVVGVVGLNRDGFKSHSSNFGSILQDSGIAVAAGDDGNDASARWNALADDGIRSTWNDGTQSPGWATYGNLWGTSFAAPQVAGVVSLMLSVNPGLSYGQVIEGLRKSARPHASVPAFGLCSWDNPGRCACTTDTCGGGILDAEQALLYAANPTTYVAPARQGAVIDNPEVRGVVALGPDRDPNPGDPPTVTPPPTDSGDSGGGAAGPAAWLLALLLAAAALWPARRSARARHGR
jgi:serine protease